MPRTNVNLTGDGVTATLLLTNIQLPDAGSSVLINGRIQVPASAALDITGSPLTFPAAPGAGIINVIIQVNTATGAASIKQNTSPGVFPTPDAGNTQVFQTVLQTTDTNLALDADNVTPDTI